MLSPVSQRQFVGRYANTSGSIVGPFDPFPPRRKAVANSADPFPVGENRAVGSDGHLSLAWMAPGNPDAPLWLGRRRPVGPDDPFPVAGNRAVGPIRARFVTDGGTKWPQND